MEPTAIVVLTLAALCVLGFPVRALFRRVHVAPAVSLMTLGVVLGPSAFDLLPDAWHVAGIALSKAAFVVLLLRAGFGLRPSGLRLILWPAIIFGTLPVAVELLAVTGLARIGLFARWDLCILAGFLVAAVSPAVILPTMLAQEDRGLGARHLVPDRIIGQTVINAFVAQTGILLMVDVLAPSGDGDVLRSVAMLPLTLVGGIAAGVAVGFTLRVDPLLRDEKPRVGHVRLATLIALAGALAVYFGCGALGLETVFATLAVGFMLRRRLDRHEARIRAELRGVWSVAEIILFVTLGSKIDMTVLGQGQMIFLLLGLLAIALLARLVAAHLLEIPTELTLSERRYVTLAHVPKATIQAVFGAYPLTVFAERLPGNLALREAGQLLVVLAVLAIVATAPIGAVLLDRLGDRWLTDEGSGETEDDAANG